jgi:hypothetical protein
MVSLRRGMLALSVTLAGMAGLLMCGVSAAQAGPLPPTQDPFYSYSGSLTGVANGAVLRVRQIKFDPSGGSVPVSTDQVLFKTTDEQGNATVAVTTVIQPLAGATQKIVSYQWAYDGLAANCEPSYAVQGGTPTESTNPDEAMLSAIPLAAGDTVVVTDYESEGNDFAAGRMEGQITLDGITAAENLLSYGADTQVALVGYSGGAIASDWAAELAGTYAPTLDIIGTAMGGVAVDLDHNLNYVNGSQEWSGAIPAALIGISRAFGINLSPYLSSYGQQVYNAVAASCLTSDLGAYPGLTLQKMLKPQYTNVEDVPPFVKAINTLIMGTGGIPEGPIYMGIGDTDGVGDDVMVLADDEALAHKYCADGLDVEFTVYKNEDHGNAGTLFIPSGLSWAVGRLAGTPAMAGCSSIPAAGDSLAPLAEAASSGSPRPTATLQLQYRSESGRIVHLRLRAVHATLKPVTVRLLNGRGNVLASRTVAARRGKLLLVSLVTRSKLKPGTYRIIATSGKRTLAKRTFTVRAAARQR